MKMKQRKIAELGQIRKTGDRSYLDILKQELLRENDVEVARELRQTIVYLDFIDNRFAIDHLIPDHLKEIQIPVGHAKKAPWTLFVLFALIVALFCLMGVSQGWMEPDALITSLKKYILIK